MYRYSALLLLVSTLLTFAACESPTLYEEMKSTAGEGWAYSDTLSFAFDVPSTDQAYDLEIMVDHGVNFPYENFYLNIYTDLPTGRRTKERINLDLAGDFGVWNGDCSGGRCAFRIPILRNTRYQQAGRYGITLEQNSRDEPLAAIHGVGIRLQKAQVE